MTWWQRLWRRKQMEEQLDKEMRFHLEQHTNELIAQGHNPEEARREARLAIGGPEQVKENCRDARGTRWLEDLFQDVRFAIRMLRQKSGICGCRATDARARKRRNNSHVHCRKRRPAQALAISGSEQAAGCCRRKRTGKSFWRSVVVHIPELLWIANEKAARWKWPRGAFGGGALREPEKAEYVEGREISADLFSVLGVNP